MRGKPGPDNISATYAELLDLSSRMQMRRFTRLANGSSKKLENHAAAKANQHAPAQLQAIYIAGDSGRQAQQNPVSSRLTVIYGCCKLAST